MKRIVILAVCLIIGVSFLGRALLYWHGLRVTSWWRSPWHNKTIGGKWYSLHQIGWAYDVIPINTLMQEVIKIWPFKVVVESDHIHLQIL